MEDYIREVFSKYIVLKEKVLFGLWLGYFENGGIW